MDQTGSILLTEVLQQSHAEAVIPDMLFNSLFVGPDEYQATLPKGSNVPLS